MDSRSEHTLVVLTGPTAVGKTELSLRLAKLLSCPVVSADSRQIYKHLSIGTAAPTAEEQKEVQHFFVQQLELEDYYSAARYEADVMKLLGQLFLMHKYVLLTGGSMMYIDAVCKGIDDIPTVDDDTRRQLRQRLQTEGLETLREELRLLDPVYYQHIDPNNTQRVVHALEICYMTGKPYSSFLTNPRKTRPFRIVRIGLTRNRASLFERINRRVDKMMQQGLLEEARSVAHLRHLNSLNTVGYKEMLRVIDGEWPLDMAVERLKKNTRVYAKKQLTWFQRDKDIRWIDLDEKDEDAALAEITGIIGL